MEPKKVTLMTNVGELISEYPDSVEILIDYGIPCASCHFSSYDTIADSVTEFMLDKQDVEDLLLELNELVEVQKPQSEAKTQ